MRKCVPEQSSLPSVKGGITLVPLTPIHVPSRRVRGARFLGVAVLVLLRPGSREETGVTLDKGAVGPSNGLLSRTPPPSETSPQSSGT